MTLAIPLPRGLRHPSWLVLLLLPVLPLLRQYTADASSANDANLLLLALLIVASVGLTIAVPELIERLGPRVRKEVELLRPAWLTSLFVVQVAVLGGEDIAGLAIVLFVATAILIATLPFGAEFQQRTLATLLAQPFPRLDWWRIKTRVLGAALAVHWLLLLLALAAIGQPPSATVVWGSLVAAVVVGATAPWWTLISRSLLAGLVFTVAVPLLTLVVLAWLDPLIPGYPLPQRWLDALPFTTDELTLYVIVYGLAPIYALVTHLAARRIWLRFEAHDLALGDSGLLRLPTLRTADRSTRTSTSVFRQLLAKEFRVQTATVLLAFAALILAGATIVPVARSAEVTFALHGGLLMLAGTTILLAGATSIAEERRLGTLDAQLLQPLPRSTQWWIKLGVAVALCAAVGGTVALVRACAEPNAQELTEIAVGAGIFLCLFSTATLASSAANHSLRALLAAVAISGVALFLLQQGHFLVDRGWSGIDVYGLMTDPSFADDWTRRVAARGPESTQARLDALAPLVANAATVMNASFGLLVLPGFLALFFARRNFVRAEARAGRVARQVGWCFLLLGAVLFARLAIAGFLRNASVELGILQASIEQTEWEQRLSPGEKLLLAHYPADRHPWNRAVQVLANPRGPFTFHLPLAPDHRRTILDWPLLPQELRRALLEDDARDTRPRSPRSPTPAPAPESKKASIVPLGRTGPTVFRMDPAMMRRYGLLPKPDATPDLPPTPPTATPEPAPEAPKP